MSRARFVVAAAVMCCLSGRMSAQLLAPAYTEYRGDAIVGRGTSAQAGLGAVYLLGTYVRTTFDAAAGATWRYDEARLSGRADVIARFLLDPFREVPIGLSVGGGVSVPYTNGDTHVRPYLTAVVDIEGRIRHDITPALQIGLGAGTRIGIAFRTSPPTWR
ncbi:MAG: hypothetical protein ACREPM_18255 [Gemmatimonadaceae bacterium]